MTDSNLAPFVTHIREYCGQSLRAIAVHAPDTEVLYLRDDLHETTSGTVVERWAEPPRVSGQLPRAIVTVYDGTTTLHISRDASTVVSLVLEPIAAGRLNEFVEYCRDLLNAASQS